MKIQGIILLAGAALAPSLSSLAHNPLAHPDWCTEDGRLIVVDEFAWSHDNLVGMLRRGDGDSRGDGDTCPLGSEGSGPDGDRTCGQFDDDWLQAFRLSSSHCAQFSIEFDAGYHPDYGTVAPIAVSPDEFLDADYHHELYFLELGLSGACVRCEPRSERPTRPIDPER